jgi:hypothetical protein
MKYGLGFEISGTTGNCTASWTTVGIFFVGFTHDRLSTTPMNCSIDTASASQGRICGIDDDIDFLISDVAPH